MTTLVPVFKPDIDASAIKAAVDALELGWLGMGSYVRDFEQALTEYLKVPDDRALVSVNTCTSALHLALRAAGVGPGDEVITPSLNNIGDFQAIAMCGARPVFVDIREDDLAIDPGLVENAIGPRVKAIIALHYMGVPCQIDTIFQVARRHQLRLIEDAAHAVGTTVDGRCIGSNRDLACFSFDAIKTLTCIDGGAVVLPTRDEAERVQRERLLGMTQSIERLYANSRSQKYDVPGPGFRYHLANLHAAIGLSQLRRLPAFIANRRSYCRRYNEAFSDLTDVLPPTSTFDDASIFHYVVRAVGGTRDELMTFLRSRGIETGIHWLPGHWFSWLKSERGATSLPITDRVGSEIVTLPLWSHMPDDVLDRIIDAVRAFGRRASIASARRRLAGRELLNHIRKAPPEATPYRIPIAAFADYNLRCVLTTAPREDDVERLTEWRNRHVKSFLTEFHATRERTRDWLVNTVANDGGRALFMIEDGAGRIAGYIGLANIDWDRRTAEADSVVRGEPDRPGLMTASLRALLDWARQQLGIQRFSVRVLSDNPAVSFYERFGFSVRRSVPLRPIKTDDCLAWEETQDAGAGTSDDRVLLYMEES